MVEAIKIGNKTLVMDGKILSLFRRGSLLRQMYYGGYEDFDGANGGVWKKYINIPIKTVPLEYAQYLIEIDDTNVSVYNVEGTLKAQSSIASEFWSLVRSDGFDIRVFDHLFNQLWFWVEMFDYTNKKAKIWVRLPENSEELNIAFGNEKAYESSYDDPNQVFEFFDDFEDGVLSSEYVTFGEGGKEANGVLTLKDTDSSFDAVFLNRLLDYNHVVYARVYARDLEAFQNRILQQDPSVNKNFYRAYFDAGETRINKNVNGTWSSLVSLAWQPSLNTWFIERIVVDITGGEIRFEFPEYGKSLSLTETLNWTSGYFGFGVYQADIDIDYWFIEKLADPVTFDTPKILEF